MPGPLTSIARLEGVTKTYRLGAERSNWRALVPGPFGERLSGETFQALDHIDLDIEQGTSVGIVGANGAGKSTLLKLLAGVVSPTEGVVEVRGRVASVIELGVGFNPDLTGAENLRFASALHGQSQDDLDERWDDIVAFSGVGEFLDTPIKRYSVGMRARLGFSLVTAFPSDLLLLDEVLSVGDWEFQQRSLNRIRELREQGTTIVAVSHSNWLLTQLCDHLVLIEGGRVVTAGDPVSVIGRYLGEHQVGLGRPHPNGEFTAEVYGATAADSSVEVLDLRVLGDRIEPGDDLRFSFDLLVHRPTTGRLVLSFYTVGRAAFAEPAEGPSALLEEPGRHRVEGSFRVPIAPGAYQLRVAVIPEIQADDIDHAFPDALAVANAPFSLVGDATRRPGLLLEVAWEVDRGSAAPSDRSQGDGQPLS